MQVPTNEKRWLISHNGLGNVYGTYGVNLTATRKRARVSEPVLKAIDESDSASLTAPASAFVEYNDRTYALSDNMFRSDTNDPISSWALASGFSSVGSAVADMVVFDTLLLYSDATDIYSYNGSTHADWWTTTLGQAALVSGDKHIMEVGPDGNLYIVDSGKKVYKVPKNGSGTGTPVKSGAGTLDFSARNLTITCMVSTSTRLWIGFSNADTNSTFIAEWDMGPQSISANRLHPIGATAVRCIGVWNDTPYAVLSTGKIQYFNGASFADLEWAQFPFAQSDRVTNDEFIHFNGWDVIDGRLHFLTNSIFGTSDTAISTILGEWYYPSGIWCLDPEIGLYQRFLVGAGTSTQIDNGQPALSSVGSLYALEDRRSKFLCSYDYKNTAGTNRSVISYHDITRSKPARGWFATEWFENQADVWKDVKTLFKKLTSGEVINLYYRQHDQDQITLSGAWSDTTNFHTTDTTTSVSVGDTLLVKQGSGAGCLSKITKKQTSASTTVLTIDEANPFVTAGDQSTVDVINFKRFKSITATNVDWDTVAIPSVVKSRKVQLLIELRQNASSKLEFDYVIIM